ncbi:MAG: hypothetical protein QNL12_15615 [Acidimicrobiia bacterium]|nr:hypothetical protein [Acidimicrobiia bacterium]MDX2468741.1 hypothetical protein [Acidimicrobiia bacterium]
MVSSLCGAVEPTEAIEPVAARVTAVFGMPEDLAVALLETTRTEAMVLDQSLA